MNENNREVRKPDKANKETQAKTAQVLNSLKNVTDFDVRMVYLNLREELIKVCRLNYVSLDERDASSKPNASNVFENIKDLIAWCDVYYANGCFLFRGQTKHYPLISSLHREVTPKHTY